VKCYNIFREVECPFRVNLVRKPSSGKNSLGTSISVIGASLVDAQGRYKTCLYQPILNIPKSILAFIKDNVDLAYDT
jgi:hypothetical protein